MENITLALALLLGTGFVAAKIGQYFRLPSVTGYIVAGILLGPSGFNIITEEAITEQLGHFTQIALMLIAFGIGEHLEIKKLRFTAKKLVLISFADVVTAFLFVSSGIFIAISFFPGVDAAWTWLEYLVVALLLGSVSMATAPAAILHVMREMRATGRFTTSLLQIIAIDNGLAIMMFGITVAVTSALLGGQGTIWQDLAGSFGQIILSLLIGIATGLLIDMVFQKLKRRSEMLIAGLALLLLCGEGARVLGLSPLLAGMVAGFVIVNKDHRDVRLFRVLNAFEAPIYVLFFTLAGAHLHVSSLSVAGWFGILYFSLRAFGKYSGAKIGAAITGASRPVRNNLGVALIPQAGVAIGLIFLITADDILGGFSSFITPIVLAGVFLSELIGPVFVRKAVKNAGEAFIETAEGIKAQKENGLKGGVKGSENVELVPWSWGKLNPPSKQQGTVIFGAAHSGTVAGLARMATLLADYHGACPLAARIDTSGQIIKKNQTGADREELFEKERKEVGNLGYELDTKIVRASSVAKGLLTLAREKDAKAIILGYPLKGTAQEFQRVVEEVAQDASCPVIVIRFTGILHTEKILVPVTSMADLHTVRNLICALAEVGQHRIRLLRLMPPDANEEELLDAEYRLLSWTNKEKMTPCVRCRSVTTESRLASILEEESNYDLLVMAASQSHGLHRLFFGSLAGGVSQKSSRPLVMVYGPRG